MRWLLIYIFIFLLLPLESRASDDKTERPDTVVSETAPEFETSQEDKELIAELELIELLELLENMNALASMEDTE